MDDNKISFFKYIKLKIKNKIDILRKNGIRGSWKNVSNKAKETIFILVLCGTIMIICIIFAIREVQTMVRENIDVDTGVIITIDNKTDSKIYKNNNNIVIEEEYRTAEIIADNSLYIREEPNSDSKILGTFPSRYMIQVEYEKNGWCKLYNNPGWISAKYIKYIN